MSLMQILTALCYGGAVYLLPRSLRGDGAAISSAIVRHGITLTFSTPSEVASWIRQAPPDCGRLRCCPWQTALVGGEMLSRFVLDEFARLDKADLRFCHMYGTIEATFCAAVVELDYRSLRKGVTTARSGDDLDGDTSELTANQDIEASGRQEQRHYPAGIPLPNYKIYVLDECCRPLPPGLQGEVYIAGAGVRRESHYLNNVALSRRTFLKDPFASHEERARGWGYMQRTGDLGRWQVSSGNGEGASGEHRPALIIEGRVQGDTMVKLRGLRLDLREVEVALLRAAAVAVTGTADQHHDETDEVSLKDAVVSVRQRDPNSPEFLAAHVLAFTAGSNKPCLSLPRSFVRRLRPQLEVLGLPPNLHPAFIVAVESLPMTSSGKLDRKAVTQLPLKDNTNDAGSSITWTATEATLKGIWKDVLFSRLSHLSDPRTTPEPEMPNMTPQTDFFHIGGTSLSLLTLRQRIKQEFGGAEIPIVDLFDSSTLSYMARRIERGNHSPVESAGAPSFKPIDWEEETRLRPSMLTADPVPVNTRLVPQDGAKQGKVVILTGATGHLGLALVQSLTSNPAVAEVHCLAVRNPFTRTDIDPLRQNPKVKLYQGDLGQPQMGLFKLSRPTTAAAEAGSSALSTSGEITPASWIRALFGRADVIIHNGADTSYLKTYHSLRASNLTTTKDLIDWCLLATCSSSSSNDNNLDSCTNVRMKTGGTGRMIPFHFVSTSGVGNLLFSSSSSSSARPKDGQHIDTMIAKELTPSSLGALTPPTDGSMGYTCSKWASERFLERLVVERFPQWEVYIHRPTVISRGKDLIVPTTNTITTKEEEQNVQVGEEDLDGRRERKLLRCTVPQFDGVHNIFWFARELNAVPRSTGIARGVLNLVRAKDVVEGILATAGLVHDLRSNGPGAKGDLGLGGLRFVNHAGELNLGLDEMRTWAAVRGREADGYLYVQGRSATSPTREDGSDKLSLREKFDEIPLEDWVHRACGLGMHPALAELLLSFARNGEVVFPDVVTA